VCRGKVLSVRGLRARLGGGEYGIDENKILLSGTLFLNNFHWRGHLHSRGGRGRLDLPALEKRASWRLGMERRGRTWRENIVLKTHELVGILGAILLQEFLIDRGCSLKHLGQKNSGGELGSRRSSRRMIWDLSLVGRLG